MIRALLCKNTALTVRLKDKLLCVITHQGEDEHLVDVTEIIKKVVLECTGDDEVIGQTTILATASSGIELCMMDTLRQGAQHMNFIYCQITHNLLCTHHSNTH